MKMLQEDFDALRGQLGAVRETPQHADYRKRCIDRGASFALYAWGVFHARTSPKMEECASKDFVIQALLLNNRIYSYCHDAHIETALRKALNKKDYVQ